MPAQDKLIRKLQENPPGDFAELESLMQECGYGITVTDPKMSMGESEEAYADESDDMDAEESMQGEQLPEDIREMLATMMPVAAPAKHDLSHKGRGKARIKVAKLVLGGEPKKGDR